MSQHITLEKNGLRRQVKAGFSWTTFFFGAWVPLLRGMWLQVFIILLTFGLAYFWYIFTINRTYGRKLIENGWAVAPHDLTTARAAWGLT